MENSNNNFNEGKEEITFETVRPMVDPESDFGGYGQPSGVSGGSYKINYEDIDSERKREIKRLSNVSSLPLIFFDIIAFVLVLIIQIVMVVTFGEARTEEIFKNPDFNYLVNGFFSLMFFSLPFVLVAKSLKTPLNKIVAFGKCKFSKALSATMLGFGVIAVSQYASAYFIVILESLMGEKVVNPMPEYGTGGASFIINLVCVGLIPAIMEEFAFRGVILGVTRKYTSDGFAIIVNAVLFSMLHGNLNQIPFTLALGFFLAYITVYTGTVVPAMVVHGVNNGLSVVISTLSQTVLPFGMTVVVAVYYGVLLLIGIGGLVMLINGRDNPFRLSKERSEDTKMVAKNYFTSVGFVIFSIITVYSVLDAQYNLTDKILK